METTTSDEANFDDDELPLLLVRAGKAMVDRLAAGKVVSPETSGMTVVHGLAARYIASHDGVTNVELAQHLGVTKQSTSEVVGALERSGFVRRTPHPDDGRARVLTLTAEGRRRLDDSPPRLRALEDDWEALVGRDQLDAVRHCLEAYLVAYPSSAHEADDPEPTAVR